jgi:hypothetical protein
MTHVRGFYVHFRTIHTKSYIEWVHCLSALHFLLILVQRKSLNTGSSLKLISSNRCTGVMYGAVNHELQVHVECHNEEKWMGFVVRNASAKERERFGQDWNALPWCVLVSFSCKCPSTLSAKLLYLFSENGWLSQNTSASDKKQMFLNTAVTFSKL